MSNIVSERVKLYSSFQETLDSEFFFSGIAYRDGDVFIGNTSDKSYVKSISDISEGRFFSVVSTNDTMTFKTDDTGQELLFYYWNGSDWAISNSFKKISEYLYDNGVELTINYASLIPFQGEHSFCEALIGNKTVINEIHLLSAAQYIEVSKGEFSLIAREKKEHSKNLVQIAKNYIHNWTSRLKLLVDNLPKGSIMCDLTGGMDSRLILSLLLASNCDLRKIDFVSNPLAKPDLEIANLLAEKYNLNLNKYEKKKKQNLTVQDQLDLTLYSSLGVYHGFYTPLNIGRDLAIHLHGGGGGLFRQVFNSNFEQILLNQERFYPNKTFLARSIEQLIKFDRNKIDSSQLPAPERSIKYFYETRNRYHFGRNWFKSIERNLVTPLISNDVLDMRMLSKDLLDDKELYLLLFLLTTPELLQYPFDRDDKNFSIKSIEKVRAIISTQSLEFNDFTFQSGSLHIKMDNEEEVYTNYSSQKGYNSAQLLYNSVFKSYKTLNKSYLSEEFKAKTEIYLESRDLSKKACRNYLYLFLLDFLGKITSNKDISIFHHKDILSKAWDKKIFKNSPTITNSLNINNIAHIVDNGKITADYLGREYNIKQNIIIDGRYRQPLFLDKVLTKQKLEGAVNVAEGSVFKITEIDEAWAFIQTLKTKSGVVKPISGVGGYGITTNIQTYHQLYSAINLIDEDEFLLEEFYAGDDCRIYVVGGKAIAATLRKPPEIIGDGISTLSQLIEMKRVERSQKAYFKKHEIEIDEAIYKYYHVDDVIGAGKVLKLNDTGNISRGGESYDITDLMHPSFQELAAACWIAYGCYSDHFAIDVICESITQDLSLQKYAVLELNAKPGHGQHVYPYLGTSRRLSDEIVDYWFPKY